MGATGMHPAPVIETSKRPELRVVDAAGAGFPSPAQDWEEAGIDLSRMLDLDKASTFVFRVSGDSMISACLFDGDVMVVDRAADVRNGSVVVAVCDGGFVVRRIEHIRGVPHLVNSNPDRPYPPRICDEDVDVWGVVKSSIHTHAR
jgi:DNA polymerase V